jgi:hypothetical protein
VRAIVVDVGVDANGSLNACLWLSIVAGLSRIAQPLPEVLQASVGPLDAIAAVVPAALRKGRRAHRGRDAVGIAALKLRRVVCDQMGGAAAIADLFPAFAALYPAGLHEAGVTIAAYHAWLQRTKAWEFADQLHLSHISRVLRLWITILPVNNAWVVTNMNIAGVGADRRIYLGNDNVHYVWLSPIGVGAAGAPA